MCCQSPGKDVVIERVVIDVQKSDELLEELDRKVIDLGLGD